ncbi:16S rRNA (cytosine(1402)-N(4))-methyltransferase RsmH [Desulfohalovibrio reitneri]|uniref:16S rRNA (cytosine(1402)-N(4))-methyltransferase RsmH n=1 Tax=Desulfohalovibrio reitneri TaxID=1307759 RepID=UPI0004A6C4C6|nr:16S rRNA (cytosine(1402)-N(4))-methyltransferase RsmH [Desulfohalovibrio reitneri]
MRHVPVLRDEVVAWLSPRPGGRYLDGTLGLGGHARAVMEAAGGEAELIGLDRDREALQEASANLAEFGDKMVTRHMPYSLFEEALDQAGWDAVDGALLDLGVSSLQLDSADRGFSFLREGPLDMRMDASGGNEPASVLVNTASFDRLRSLIRELGEEPQAGRIARAISRRREERPFESTLDLAEVVESAYPAKWRRTARMHPATRTFQALRMAVNDELGQLREFLDRVPERLKPGGRVAVISFHSLEDRMVKRAFREEARECVCPPRQPVCTCEKKVRLKVLTKKPVTAGEAEAEANPRARSAKLRVAEGVAHG